MHIINQLFQDTGICPCIWIICAPRIMNAYTSILSYAIQISYCNNTASLAYPATFPKHLFLLRRRQMIDGTQTQNNIEIRIVKVRKIRRVSDSAKNIFDPFLSDLFSEQFYVARNNINSYIFSAERSIMHSIIPCCASNFKDAGVFLNKTFQMLFRIVKLQR